MANTSSDNVSNRDIFYFRQRQKNRVFQLILAHFSHLAEKENLSKKELAVRLGKDPAQITRWFSGPGNWTLDTISDLLLAMKSEMKYEIVSLSNNANQPKIIHFEQNQIEKAPITDTSSTDGQIYRKYAEQ